MHINSIKTTATQFAIVAAHIINVVWIKQNYIVDTIQG